MTSKLLEWSILDEGDVLRMPAERSRGHYEKHFDDPGKAAAEAQRLATERGHIVRVVATFWPEVTRGSSRPR